MKLNPDLKESALNRKGINVKRIKHMENEELKNYDMVSAVKEALDFTEALYQSLTPTGSINSC